MKNIQLKGSDTTWWGIIAIFWVTLMTLLILWAIDSAPNDDPPPPQPAPIVSTTYLTT